MAHNQELIIRKVLERIQDHFHEPLTVEGIAAEIGCSYPWLAAIFKKSTGTTILTRIIQCRMEKAKELLVESDLSVSEIVFEVGFNSHESFANCFRKRNGMSASAFRKGARIGKDKPVTVAGGPRPTAERVWLEDSFKGRALQSWWNPLMGKWRQESNILFESDQMHSAIGFTKPMPENFRISFEVKRHSAQSVPSANFNVVVVDEKVERIYCSLSLATHQTGMGELRVKGRVERWSRLAVIEDNNWHAVDVELRDDEICLRLDNEVAYTYRDPFPPSYSIRCKFILETWCTSSRFRNFAIHDLGFLPFVRTVRQGDSVYNAGLFEQARDFYIRQLESGLSGTDVMELRYKVGMCFLRQGAMAQARGWLDKVVTLPERDFWSQQARLATVESKWDEDRADQFFGEAARMFSNTALRSGIRHIMKHLEAECSRKGFNERAEAIGRQMVNMEGKTGYAAWLAMYGLAEICFSLNRFDDAQEHLLAILGSGPEAQGLHHRSLILLADTYLWQGKFPEALSRLQSIPEEMHDPFILSRREVLHAMCLRGQRRFEEATEHLRQIAERFPQAKETAGHARFLVSEICCSLGQLPEAEQAIKDAEELHPMAHVFYRGVKSRYSYVPRLLAGDFAGAAKVLAADAQTKDRKVAIHAEQGVHAGIMLCLADDHNAAREMWSQTARRFPPAQCNFYGELAKNLVGEKDDHLEDMPYSAGIRSEMFYLCALLQEDQGDPGRSRELLEMSVREDPTLRWPAWLAKGKLQEG